MRWMRPWSSYSFITEIIHIINSESRPLMRYRGIAPIVTVRKRRKLKKEKSLYSMET
jgi:hypothetical protein